jgi:hypothetical protein
MEPDPSPKRRDTPKLSSDIAQPDSLPSSPKSQTSMFPLFDAEPEAPTAAEQKAIDAEFPEYRSRMNTQTARINELEPRSLPSLAKHTGDISTGLKKSAEWLKERERNAKKDREWFDEQPHWANPAPLTTENDNPAPSSEENAEVEDMAKDIDLYHVRDLEQIMAKRQTNATTSPLNKRPSAGLQTQQPSPRNTRRSSRGPAPQRSLAEDWQDQPGDSFVPAIPSRQAGVGAQLGEPFKPSRPSGEASGNSPSSRTDQGAGELPPSSPSAHRTTSGRVTKKRPLPILTKSKAAQLEQALRGSSPPRDSFPPLPTKSAPVARKPKRGRPKQEQIFTVYERHVLVNDEIVPISTLPDEVCDALNDSLDALFNDNFAVACRITKPVNYITYVNSGVCIGQHIFGKGKGKPKRVGDLARGCAACGRTKRPCVQLQREGEDEVRLVFYPRHENDTPEEAASTDMEYWL